MLLLHGLAGVYLLSKQVPLDAGGTPPAGGDDRPRSAAGSGAAATGAARAGRRAATSAASRAHAPSTAAARNRAAEGRAEPGAKAGGGAAAKAAAAPQAQAGRAPAGGCARAAATRGGAGRHRAARAGGVHPRTPAPAPPAINSGAARASWQAQLVGWLERNKRYPRLAQEQRQEGTVYLRFAIDRQGRVLSSQIERGSGYALLDEEVLALIQRAQPLPAPPAEVLGARIELTVPIQFSLRGGAR